MNVIIYYRKSTDRDDKQANSLEHQLNNCRKTAELKSLKVFKEIWESRSAKTEGTRPWFNELIKICKTWKIDYIIIDETKRLSRNNIDTSRVIDLLDKKQIKAILWTSREYKWDNSRDKFLLQLDLSLSKMDNEDRAKDIKDKMTSCINNTWRFLWKAPFWYKNITIRKWYKDIIIDKDEAKIVKEIYALRLENKAYTSICNILKDKYGTSIKLSYSATRIHDLIAKKFYYWVFLWDWKVISGCHKPIITKETYDEVNDIWKWVHEKKKTLDKIQSTWEWKKYYFKWFIKDMSWIILTSYIKKWFTYYSNQPRSLERVSINENIIFDTLWDIIKKMDIYSKVLQPMDKELILSLLAKEKKGIWKKLESINSQITKLKKKQDKLLDLKLDEKINTELYTWKYNDIENEVHWLIHKKQSTKKDNFEEKTWILFELAGSFYRSYFSASNEWKVYIIKNLLFELSVNTQKELQIAESSLFKSSKMLDFNYGAPEQFDIRTFKEYLLKINLEELKKFNEFIKKNNSQ